jgi:hypothetical protein
MRLLGSLVAVAVLAASLTAAENPQVAAIHNQIKALKAEEKVTLKTIHAWYESFIKRDKFTGAVLLQERKVLAKQEQELLAVAATPEAKNEIRAHYDALRALLREDSKIDAAVIRKLRQMEKAHETYVGNAYKSKIHDLEAQAKTLAAAGKAAKPKKK